MKKVKSEHKLTSAELKSLVRLRLAVELRQPCIMAAVLIPIILLIGRRFLSSDLEVAGVVVAVVTFALFIIFTIISMRGEDSSAYKAAISKADAQNRSSGVRRSVKISDDPIRQAMHVLDADRYEKGIKICSMVFSAIPDVFFVLALIEFLLYKGII